MVVACGPTASTPRGPGLTAADLSAPSEPTPDELADAPAPPTSDEAYGPDAPVVLSRWPIEPVGFYDVEAPFLPARDDARSYPAAARVYGEPGPHWARAERSEADALVRLVRGVLLDSDLGPPTNCHLRVGVWPVPDFDADGEPDRLVRADWVVPAADGAATDELATCGAIRLEAVRARVLPDDVAAGEAWAGEVVFVASGQSPSPPTRFLGLVQHTIYDPTTSGTGLRVDDVVTLPDARLGLAGRIVDFCEAEERHVAGTWVGSLAEGDLEIVATTLSDDPCATPPPAGSPAPTPAPAETVQSAASAGVGWAVRHMRRAPRPSAASPVRSSAT